MWFCLNIEYFSSMQAASKIAIELLDTLFIAIIKESTFGITYIII